MTQRSYGNCFLCEAACGLEVEHDGRTISHIRGDGQDVASRGYICPKAVALQDLHADPDRLRQPLRRVGDRFEEVSWDVALADISRRLVSIQEQHGKSAVAVYRGNPVGHSYAGTLLQILFDGVLATRNRYSAASVDALPRQLMALLMYGNQAVMSVPDLERTDYFLVLGGNPLVSNGSIMTAPDPKRRLRELRERGGRLVVVDPRRTETAKVADEHVFIRPGTDAGFLLGLLHVLFAEGHAKLGELAGKVRGLERVKAAVEAYPPERAARYTGVSADTTVRIARELAGAKRAACYGRMGTSTQDLGTVATWLIELVNVVSGNLDRPGGMMFNTPVVDLPKVASWLGKQGSFNTFQSRVGELPEIAGELPVAALADEIETSGQDQIRALFTHAGNPVLSLPNGKRLEKAFTGLDFMVSLDLYLNETTRLADYVLPSTFGFERDDYQLLGYSFGVRNRSRYVRPFLEPPTGVRHDWEILLALAVGVLREREQTVAATLLEQALARLTPKRVLDLLVRLGPHGGVGGLTLSKLEAHAHGLDLGALEPRLDAVVAHEDGLIDLAPEPLIEDLKRVEDRIAAGERSAVPGAHLLLIGRRTLRSNNSWMHNSERLVKGRPRCTLLMHPKDAAARNLRDGDLVTVTSRVGELDVPLEVSADVMDGVVCMPHGWGHHRPGAQLRVAEARSGKSLNDITDERLFDALSGTTHFNGVPVAVAAAKAG